MPQQKQMDYPEKIKGVESFIGIVEDFAPKIVKKELGEVKLTELQALWQQGIKSIPNDIPDKEKYNIAYSNFIWKWVSANDFMIKNLGEAGEAAYMKAAISGWKKKYARSGLIFKIIGGISRKSAFKILAKRLAYQLQVFSPFTVTQLDDKHMTLAVTPCKILTDQNGAKFCSMACQNIVPSWLEAQFNIKMSLNRQGENCTATFEPYN